MGVRSDRAEEMGSNGPATSLTPEQRGVARGRVEAHALAPAELEELAWRDSLNLTAKLLAFREALPPRQQVILDGILRRAHLAQTAGLGDVSGFDSEPTNPDIAVDTPFSPTAAMLRGYFDQRGTTRPEAI